MPNPSALAERLTFEPPRSLQHGRYGPAFLCLRGELTQLCARNFPARCVTEASGGQRPCAGQRSGKKKRKEVPKGSYMYIAGPAVEPRLFLATAPPLTNACAVQKRKEVFPVYRSTADTVLRGTHHCGTHRRSPSKPVVSPTLTNLLRLGRNINISLSCDANHFNCMYYKCSFRGLVHAITGTTHDSNVDGFTISLRFVYSKIALFFSHFVV